MIVWIRPLMDGIGNTGAHMERARAAVGQRKVHRSDLCTQWLRMGVTAVVGVDHDIYRASLALNIFQIGHGIEHGADLIGMRAAVN